MVPLVFQVAKKVTRSNCRKLQVGTGDLILSCRFAKVI